MKTLIAFVLLLTLPELKAHELCSLLDRGSSTLQVLEDKQLLPGVAFYPEQQEMVVAYLRHGYELDLSFEQIMIQVGEQSGPFFYNEFHLQTVFVPLTEQVYTYVWSYPGDNEYGAWFDSELNIVAEIQDGDLVVDGEYCPYPY